MFDIGFTELLVIGVVALIVVGPKDLPGMFRTLGRFTARARQMAREFSQAMNDAADTTGAKDIASTLKSVSNPKSMGLDALNKAADGFEKWDPAKALRDQQDADAATKTPELSEERAEVARKIHAATAKAATDRQAEEAEASATGDVAKPAKKSPPVKKSAGKGATGKGAAAKTATAKAKTTKASAAKKPAAKKPATKKPAAKASSAKKAPAKKPAASKASAPNSPAKTTAKKAAAKSAPKATDA